MDGVSVRNVRRGMMTEAMQVPFSGPWVTDLEREYVADVMSDDDGVGWYEWYERFENAICEVTGTKYCILTSSGTGALEIAMRVAHDMRGSPHRSKCVMPVMTWVSARNAAIKAGYVPIYADIDDQLNMDVGDAIGRYAACLDDVSVIIPVHSYGHPANMNEVGLLKRLTGARVIEDACPALCSTYNGKPVGSLGDMATFSFSYAKPFTACGEGGALVTNDEALYERALWYSNHCRVRDDINVNGVGFKYKMTAAQAAFGLAQLERRHEILQRKAVVWHRYSKRLEGSGWATPRIGEASSPNFYLCTVNTAGVVRSAEAIVVVLRDKYGIGARTIFPLLDGGEYPHAKRAYEATVCLPSLGTITNDQVDYVCDSLLEIEREGCDK
jgi:perosamine synthetase